MATLKIENAKFILTMDPERRIISDGSILVDGQRITRWARPPICQGLRLTGPLTQAKWS